MTRFSTLLQMGKPSSKGPAISLPGGKTLI